MDRIAPVVKKHGYLPLRKVGFGSFGQAWLVGQESEGGKLQNYVCKMIDISRCTKKEKQDALHEASVLKELRHPYIVKYKESFLEDGWLCIVQEYCEGGDLYQKIQKSKKLHQTFSEDQITRWFTQCILGLKYIHEKHILHRDLKSSNFFLTRSGDIKMGDFGIAKVLECTAGVAKTQIGTPYYLSPEICQEKPYAWPSDIWAMGCILYEICCLRVPFDAADLRALVHKITRGPSPSLPGHFSSQLRSLVGEILVRDHTKRPTAAAILAKPILQDKVRQMLSEHDRVEAKRNNDAKADNKEAADAEGKGGGGAGGNVAGPYGSDAGKYVKGQIVEYYSETHKEWLPAQITAVDGDGRIQVHCKPNAWLPLNVQGSKKKDQKQKVRPRQKEDGKDKKAPEIKPPAMPEKGMPKVTGGGSYQTPRYNPPGAATPPVYLHRNQTPPNQFGRVGSPSPFGRAGTPRNYQRPGIAGGTPRGGTPRGLPVRDQSPSVRPPFQSNSPRYSRNSPRFQPPVPGAGGYPSNYRFY